MCDHLCPGFKIVDYVCACRILETDQTSHSNFRAKHNVNKLVQICYYFEILQNNNKILTSAWSEVNEVSFFSSFLYLFVKIF